MKKIIVFYFLLASVNAFSQDDDLADTTRQPAITEIGKPNGKIAEMKMNKDGGTLVSGDGKLELIIPSRALSKKTTISIQPITNMIPNGIGKAYRLEPSGIQFQQPVQLVFHYDKEESKDSMQLLLGIAMQDDKGQWLSLKKITLDTVAKTISGSISHFSDWGEFESIKLYPLYARLKVKNTLNMSIDLVSSEDEDISSLNTNDELSPLKKRKIPWTTTWKANNVINGNATVGTIKIGSKTFIAYTAPVAMPTQNPVAVTADLKGLTYRYKGVTFKSLKLVTNILIYDNAYEVKMISAVMGSAGSELGNCTYKDTGSFVVSLNGKEASIIEKVNKNAVAELDYAGDRCTVKQLKPGSGSVHIAGRPVIKITPPAFPSGSATIEIRFNRYPTLFPLLQFTCPPLAPGGRTFIGTNAQVNALAAGMLPAFPQQLKFEAKEGEQTQVIGEEGSGVFFKYTITQIKED